jgi:hypothetical protein
MKKWAVAVGTVLLILTPFLLTKYNTPYGRISTISGNWPTNPNTWTTAANFSANDIILLEFSPNIFWFSNPAALEVIDVRGKTIAYTIVDINITDPRESADESQYEFWYTFDYTSFRASFFNGTMLSVGDGINRTAVLAPTFHAASAFVLGTAKFDGTYFANATFVGGGIMYPGSDYRSNGTYPPANFALDWARTAAQKFYPYAGLLYVSFFTIPASVVFIVYGLKKAKLIRRVRRVSNKKPLET